jgi:Arc/MetJ-type ribon-helix-helix transcriptional regulator
MRKSYFGNMKVKTSIMLSEDLLKTIDQFSTRYKNRSDFIEAAIRAFVAQIMRDAPCRKAWRLSAASYALSACSLAGRLRGRPQGRLIGSSASSVASIIFPSGTLAPERVMARGIPC